MTLALHDLQAVIAPIGETVRIHDLPGLWPEALLSYHVTLVNQGNF